MKLFLFSFLILFANYSCFSQVKANEGELNGVIKVGKGRHRQILDYDFNPQYSADSCTDGLGKLIKDFSKNVDSLQYVAPILADNYKDILAFLVGELNYPEYAREKGIMGKVPIHFEITKTGEIKNLWVRKKQHISLDKEAVRVFRKLKLVTPALLDGKPFDLCLDMEIVFLLQD